MLKPIKGMRENFNNMIKFADLYDSICSAVAVSQNASLLEKLDGIAPSISKEEDKYGDLFHNNLNEMKYARSTNENDEIIYKVSNRPVIASVILIDDNKNEIIISWKEFLRKYIPLKEV